ncbi:class I SAM-dependent methyltransferase [uncultured Sphingomonas sp.]|uniref:class I SAM-dependent methyltransferase n=1 Tax=uncultured Sphingomonas sp. TaxID=158754 RepID=UPI00262BF6CC|nr:class I SAM-dependent methyltransferase [uncultured Sphingomonas sp.]
MNCRHCGHGLEKTFLDLGSAPPSNAYLDRAGLEKPETWFPLRLLVCGRCWLVQTADHAGRELLFSDDYAYFSSFSSSWLAHARGYVAAMTERFNLASDSCVVEVAANDGYLLRYVQERGIDCYGIEPTHSTAEAARAIGIEIVEEFFGVALARELVAAGRSADLMAANNVLAHVPDINDFVAGFATLLKQAGVATFEFPHLLRMMAENQFDTAYHEHFSYLSLLAVEAIFAANGLQVFDVEQLATHGGSLRIFAQRQGGPHAVTANVAAVRADEQAAGLATFAPYAAFQKAAEQVKTDFLRYLLDARATGLRVGAYGAAAKGNTLLNYAGVRPDLLPYVVDRNPAKAGRFMPGSRIPIVGEDHLRADRPDRIVILPWNLTDEVIQQLAYAREWGVRFVTAVPELIER